MNIYLQKNERIDRIRNCKHGANMNGTITMITFHDSDSSIYAYTSL